MFYFYNFSKCWPILTKNYITVFATNFSYPFIFSYHISFFIQCFYLLNCKIWGMLKHQIQGRPRVTSFYDMCYSTSTIRFRKNIQQRNTWGFFGKLDKHLRYIFVKICIHIWKSCSKNKGIPTDISANTLSFFLFYCPICQ